jgi:hypothetical protein
MAEPYFEHIKADSLTEADRIAYKMSYDRRELSTGNYDIYKLMTQEDYEADPNFQFVEEDSCDEEDC